MSNGWETPGGIISVGHAKKELALAVRREVALRGYAVLHSLLEWICISNGAGLWTDNIHALHPAKRAGCVVTLNPVSR